MRTNTFIVVFGYLRLSVDEVGKTVSGSIENQANIIRKYCAQHNLFLAELFQDDGWSGGNFERPGFKKNAGSTGKEKSKHGRYCRPVQTWTKYAGIELLR